MITALKPEPNLQMELLKNKPINSFPHSTLGINKDIFVSINTCNIIKIKVFYKYMYVHSVSWTYSLKLTLLQDGKIGVSRKK
jgi:hypothetical protein